MKESLAFRLRREDEISVGNRRYGFIHLRLSNWLFVVGQSSGAQAQEDNEGGDLLKIVKQCYDSTP